MMIKPERINMVAKKHEMENIKFRSFLKNRADYEELDEHFFNLHNELFSGYDCCKCNNCCRAYSTCVQEYEINSIASFLGITTQEFTQEHLTQTCKGYEIKSPCDFLNANGECVIQACKPEECRDFPYTDKPGRLESLLGIVSFAEECPVVFEILERLKDIYGFRR